MSQEKGKKKRGKPHTITASGSKEQKEKRFKPWNPPSKQLDEYIKRVMIREAMRVVLRVILKNHVHDFDNQMRKQTKVGLIGLELTADLAQVSKMWWDKDLATRLQEMSIIQKMNKRYVDDISMAYKRSTRWTEVQESLNL